jgi:transcriptional regulator with PAS, ATPase and Fis domain
LKDLCPEGIPNVIDVGKRAISVSTFVKLIEALQLDIKNVDTYFTTFQNMMIKGNYRIAELLRHSEDLMRNLQYIYKNSSDGILCIDDQDNVNVLNVAAKDILQLPSKETGQSYTEVLKNYPALVSAIKKGLDQDNILIDNSLGEKVVFNISFPQVSSLAKAIVFLTKYNRMQKNERRIRHKIYKENQGLVARHHFSDILGNSQELNKVKTLAMQYAKSELNVLIEGETGTGKELFAQAIHNYSDRAAEPFVACNFAALPENLVESELFGYEEGAFTGASKGGKPGLFELAHGGTIMLDEVGDASIAVQTKLLRVLEEREVMRIGSSMVTPVDVRVICATNKDLRQYVANGLFRKDLYYRIRILPLHLPSLKDRIEDIPCIVEGLANNYGIPMDKLSCIIPILKTHSWPGNVRELKSMIQYLSVILSSGDGFDERTICDYTAEYLRNINGVNEQAPAVTDEDLPCLKESYNYDFICFVLKSLYDARNDNKAIGRESIRKMAKDNGLEITDSQIRTVMRILVKYGLVRSGTTRQGSVITQRGIDFINSL